MDLAISIECQEFLLPEAFGAWPQDIQCFLLSSGLVLFKVNLFLFFESSLQLLLNFLEWAAADEQNLRDSVTSYQLKPMRIKIKKNI